MNDIIQRKFFDPSISGRNFTEQLLSSALSAGFISEEAFQAVRTELGAFLILHASGIKKPGISSVDEDLFSSAAKAQLLLMELFLTSIDQDEALKLLIRFDFDKCRDMGTKKGASLLEQAIEDSVKLRENLFPLKNAFYADFVLQSLPEFVESFQNAGSDCEKAIHLMNCDDDFDFSYPVSHYKKDAVGIEATASYIRSLRMENDFLLCFSPENVEKALRSNRKLPSFFDPFLRIEGFESDNCFTPVLLRGTESILAGEMPLSLSLSDAGKRHIEFLKKGKSEEEIKRVFSDAAERLAELLGLEKDIAEYCRTAIRQADLTSAPV